MVCDEFKKCPRCESMLHESSFYKNHLSKSGLASYCKSCSGGVSKESKKQKRMRDREQRRIASGIPDGMKRCTHCGAIRTADCFYRNSARCEECRKEISRRYYRNNKEKILKATKEYSNRNKEKLKASRKKWEDKRRDELKNKKKLYYIKNKARILEKSRLERLKDPEKRKKSNLKSQDWYHKNKNNPEVKGKRHKYQKKWMKSHRINCALREQRRRARKRILADTFSVMDGKVALNHFRNSCAVCGILFGLVVTVHWDHWIPLSDERCPGTVPDNMVPLCEGCNQSKSSSNALIWLVKNYGKKAGMKISAAVESFLSNQGTKK